MILLMTRTEKLLCHAELDPHKRICPLAKGRRRNVFHTIET
jgi:hypothetical protein